LRRIMFRIINNSLLLECPGLPDDIYSIQNELKTPRSSHMCLMTPRDNQVEGETQAICWRKAEDNQKAGRTFFNAPGNSSQSPQGLSNQTRHGSLSAEPESPPAQSHTSCPYCLPSVPSKTPVTTVQITFS
jgi:hypothetical protein